MAAYNSLMFVVQVMNQGERKGEEQKEKNKLRRKLCVNIVYMYVCVRVFETINIVLL